MKILILGGGFISDTITPILSQDNSVVCLSHKDIELTNFSDVKSIFDKNSFDFIINCANKGGRRTKQDCADDFYTNLRILENLLYFQDKYNKMIVFSSGAEKTDDIPDSYYGLSKYIQSKRVLNNKKIINLRLYNVFSEYGMKDSFIPVTIFNCLNNKDINIFKDKLFDVFYGADLAMLIKYLIQNSPEEYLEIDCVYHQKYKLSELAFLIKRLTNSINNIIINHESKEKYIGNNYTLKSFDLSLNGLENGIANCIKYHTNE